MVNSVISRRVKVDHKINNYFASLDFGNYATSAPRKR